jgi:hypothetical protein
MADAASATYGRPPIQITDEEAAYTKKANGTLFAGWFQALPEFQLLEAREGKTFKQVTQK